MIISLEKDTWEVVYSYVLGNAQDVGDPIEDMIGFLKNRFSALGMEYASEKTEFEFYDYSVDQDNNWYPVYNAKCYVRKI